MLAVVREKDNPIIRPSDVRPLSDDFEVIGVFNPGVTCFNGKTLLLLRVAERPKDRNDGYLYVPYFDDTRGEIDIKRFDKADKTIDFSDCRVVVDKDGNRYLTSFSSLAVATSDDGVHFTVSPTRLMPANRYEAFGIEDARITRIDDVYYITYTAASARGICTAMRTTQDFVRYSEPQNILYPDNKDAALFPERINGKYYLLHRPSFSEFSKPNIWLASSTDLIRWGDHMLLMETIDGGWESCRIGAASIPIRTEAGWLLIYHGADRNCRYCLGAVLLDLEKPWKVLARSRRPFLQPEEPYERQGFVDNVVFSCGSVVHGDRIDIYYGAADASVCLAQVSLSELIYWLKEAQ